jgi:hypothetical protein
MDMNFSLELAQSATTISYGGDYGSHESASLDLAISRNTPLDPFKPLGSTGKFKKYLT